LSIIAQPNFRLELDFSLDESELGCQSSKVEVLSHICKFYANFQPKNATDCPSRDKFCILAGLKWLFGLDFRHFSDFSENVRKIG